MKKTRKFNLILIIFVTIIILGLGFSYLNTTLSINGITDVDANTWNVYWNNVQVKSGSVTASTPVIDTNKTTVTFNVRLSKPGDFYEFTVDAKNDGTIDAMIESITVTDNIPDYIDYIITYEDDIEIDEKHLLSANSIEIYKVRVSYRTDINPNQLPSSSQTLTLSFGVTYVQADSSAILIAPRLYNVDTSFIIGFNVPTGTTIYDNYSDAIAEFEHPIFLKHNVFNNLVTKSYVGFVLNGNVYYLQGGIDEEDIAIQPVYDYNKAVLLNAFGSSNCTDNTLALGYFCYDSVSGLNARAYMFGSVGIFDDEGFICNINGDYGDSHCGSM